MIKIRLALSSLLLACAAAGAAPGVIPGVDMTTTLEKKDMLLHFDKAAVAGVVDEEKADGLVGYTSDLPGGALQVFIAFDGSVPEDKLFDLMNFQGRLKGTVQCKRVRVGTGTGKRAAGASSVLAEQCALKSITH